MMDGVTTEPTPPPPTTTPTTTLRERIIEAAAELTVEGGWSGVTMGRLAERVGVSRQTVYNEVGAKGDLAESLVLWELGHFLEAVNAGFDAHPDDLVEAARDAIQRVLERAEVNPLLRAAVSASEGSGTGLLPLLTTDSASLAAAAAVIIELRLGDYEHDLEPARLGALVDLLVRLVLSHVIRPSGTPEESAGHIAWVVDRALRPQP